MRIDVIKAELQIIRWPNILMMIFIQVLAFTTIVNPHWPNAKPDGIFFLVYIVLMTITSAAGGYVLNDMMDIKADAINGRNNVLNTGRLSLTYARRIYYVMLAFGALFAFNLVRWSWHYLWLFVVVSLFLWTYSKVLKRIPLIGNIAVSAFCAGTIGILWVPAQSFNSAPHSLIWLTVFAFLLTLIREIIKDLEDMEGDRRAGDRTFPLVAGERPGILLVVFLLVLVIAGLIYPIVRPDSADIISFSSWLLTLILLFVILLYLLLQQHDQKSYHLLSTILKVSMLTGTLFLVL